MHIPNTRVSETVSWKSGNVYFIWMCIASNIYPLSSETLLGSNSSVHNAAKDSIP